MNERPAVRTPDPREGLELVVPEDLACMATFKSWPDDRYPYVCTRPEGHGGRHGWTQAIPAVWEYATPPRWRRWLARLAGKGMR